MKLGPALSNTDATGEEVDATPPAEDDLVAPDLTVNRFRYLAGWFFFLLALVMPVFVVAIPVLHLSAARATALGGFLVLGGPEVSAILAVAFWGRATFDYFRARTKAMFRSIWSSLRTQPPTSPDQPS